jgi:hypothetical protein
MESKHSYFKRKARSSGQYVNITKTLAEGHQLLQAYLSAGVRVSSSISSSGDNIMFDPRLYSQAIATAAELALDANCTYFCSFHICKNGTEYVKDLLVVLRREESDLVFGKIMLCLFDAINNLFLIVEECRAEYVGHLGLYAMTQTREKLISAVSYFDLLDYYPLPEYKCGSLSVVALKHAILDKALI